MNSVTPFSEKDILEQCPDSPNCVCTKEARSSKKMEPLSFTGSKDDASQQLKQLLDTYSQATLVGNNGAYFHYEFKTALGGFIDDVEFLIDEQSKAIHFRSASRVGYGDLGKNRRRMKGIQKKWEKLLVLR